MKFIWRSPRSLAVTALAVVLAGGALALARPRPVSNAMLGIGWACSQTAFIVTTCAPTESRPIPAAETSSKDSLRLGPRV